jgi:hypothetical protein
MPTLRPPEAIWLFSTPLVRNIARPVSQIFGNWIFHRMYQWQVGRFFRDAEVRKKFVPLLYQQFESTPSARPAFFRLHEDLLHTVRSHTKMLPKLREFRRPVRIIFGDADPYLNKGVAQSFQKLFPISFTRCWALCPNGRACQGGTVNSRYVTLEFTDKHVGMVEGIYPNSTKFRRAVVILNRRRVPSPYM